VVLAPCSRYFLLGIEYPCCRDPHH
jgi:hypothetical protein